MVRDENFVVELVFSYMNSRTYQKFFVHDRVPLRRDENIVKKVNNL